MTRIRTRFVLVSLLALVAPSCSDNEIFYPDTSSEPADDTGTTDPGGSDVVAEAGETGEPDGGTVEPLDYTACVEGDSVTVTPTGGGEILFDVGNELLVGVEFPANAVAADTEASLTCVDDALVPEGFIALSPSVDVSFPGNLDRYATLTLPMDLQAIPEGARPSGIRIYFAPATGAPTLSPPAVDLQENMGRGFVTFATRHPGIYQVAIASNAGETYERTWVFRAITGVSMGCSGASMIGLRNPEEFDIIGALGGPTDWTYLAHYIEVGGMGGFKTSADGFGSADPAATNVEMEHMQTFDNFWSPTGEGTGGTFDRQEYIRIFQDLALAFGNMANYNDESPFFPPGVTRDEVARPASERCPGGLGTTMTIETGFYDDEYNPNGDLPVIMFCDGRANRDTTVEFDRYCDLDENGIPDEPNRGLYPGPEDQYHPVVIGWAVDVNGNGLREHGEPVIRNFHEPYEDVGVDGLANADEPGYDAIENPDPSGDNYEYFVNPTGTEGNWLWEDGEPYTDVGLDGVDDTPQLDEGGYDFGEGNDQFDYNPNLRALLEDRDPHHKVGELTDEQWDNLTVYLDGGIRDLFNFAVSSNQLSGSIQAAGQNMRIYDEFFSLANLDPEEDDYRFAEVEYGDLGDHVYLRYGDPDASVEDICWGDGKHVGTVPQIANRLLTLLGLITTRFPGGDYSQLEPPYPTPSGNYMFDSGSFGGTEQYSIILPPGHEWHVCCDNDDNDGDGLVDGADPDCAHGMDNSEGEGLGPALCSDGIDNDDDFLTDFPEDPDCASADDTSEWPADHPMRDAVFPVVLLLHGYGQTPDDLRATVVPFAGFMAGGIWQKVIVVYPDGYCGENSVNQCNDGIDNDLDEAIDGADPNCAASGGTNEGADETLTRCSDGVDNDHDGRIDWSEDGTGDLGCIGPETNDESECVKGNFYSDHAAWPSGESPGPPFEEVLFDLLDHVDETYRTRPPETSTEVR